MIDVVAGGGPQKTELTFVDSVDENKCAGKTLQSGDTNSYASYNRAAVCSGFPPTSLTFSTLPRF